jgi:hypothetical protein
MKQTTKTPVMLGTLEIGSKFIFDAAIWEVLEQNWSQERNPDQGKARCKKVNTPVISNICRSNYVVPA